VLSIARGLDAGRFRPTRNERAGKSPAIGRLHSLLAMFAWAHRRARVDGSPASLLKGAALFLGQAGTANEGAAAAGVPVVAFARDRGTKTPWYAGDNKVCSADALAVIAGSAVEAAGGVCDILNDPRARMQMSEIGRARLGSGGARSASRIASVR